METEKRRSFALAATIILVILLSVGWFLWENYIGYGSINVIGQAPFEVQVENGEIFSCETSPCTIKQRTGRQIIVINKGTLEAEVESVLVKLWKNVEVKIEFEFDPYILEAPNYEPSLIAESNNEYRMIFDTSVQMQKLVDEANKEIVFFPERLDSPKVFASKKSALILSQDGNYRVDIQGETRKSIGEISVKDGKWSPDGRYFIFDSEDEKLLVLHPDNEISQLDFEVTSQEVSWSTDNQIIFFVDTNQVYLFKPETDSLEIVSYYGTEGEAVPKNLYIEPDLSSIYFTVGKKGYRLVLK